MTEKAKELFFSKLNKFREKGFKPSELIETAIERGWQTVFEPNGNNKTGNRMQDQNFEAARQFMEERKNDE